MISFSCGKLWHANFLRAFVIAKPEKNRLAEFFVAGPFLVRNLGDELRR
jgi:hypothetical protein